MLGLLVAALPVALSFGRQTFLRFRFLDVFALALVLLMA